MHIWVGWERGLRDFSENKEESGTQHNLMNGEERGGDLGACLSTDGQSGKSTL